MLIGEKIDGWFRGDKGIWTILIVLSLASLLAVYSSTGTKAFLEMNGNTSAYVFRHGMILVAGLFLTFICHRFHYMVFARLATFGMLLAIPLLLYTLLFGSEINQARRWIEIPLLGLSFQTSDYAKLALIAYLALTISKNNEYIKDFRKGFLPLIIPTIVICGLIMPSNFSTAALLLLTCVVMMFIGRVAVKYLGVMALGGALLVGGMVALGSVLPDDVRVNTWANRIAEFKEGGEGGYQVQLAKIAIANGGWTGVGPGNSFQRNYLPYSYADFIYAIICEEYGLIGAILIVSCYLYLFYRCVKLVTRSPHAFGAHLAMGLSLSIMVQAFANMAVSVNLMPVTGVTLPLVSMGGTSILFMSVTLGIILSVSRHTEETSVSPANTNIPAHANEQTQESDH